MGKTLLSALIAKVFGTTGVIATVVADFLIADYANEAWLEMTRETYGNQYALNHYKYVETYYTVTGSVTTKTHYNPAIYSN
ncbi:hypothetical protein KQI42_20315 [Tissierella sp. MSJ-40]|uniref:Uncharacterized protein n=1 Tax=Tissierella simiarum TaxID=2841534 RepID=A0ABS6EC51_9FIRM|nr:hypothetical protein [Tissierella simiarum]MBU5440344.1 hypothetical protein [Tissierella simiarum]